MARAPGIADQLALHQQCAHRQHRARRRVCVRGTAPAVSGAAAQAEAAPCFGHTFDDRHVLRPGGHVAHARGEGVARHVTHHGELRKQAQHACGKAAKQGACKLPLALQGERGAAGPLRRAGAPRS